MHPITFVINAAERLPLPDSITNLGIDYLVGRTKQSIAASPNPKADEDFVRAMTDYPIAEHTDAANEQHYELPPRFFELTLGPRRKYSSCLYPNGTETLAEAEVLALRETAQHAELADGQTILELGCGWGSLTLFMAENYPNSTITAVSNSAPQRLHIEAEAKRRRLSNVTIITADMNNFDAPGTFDRIVSVEMFEHMANWQTLLTRVRGWIKPEGKLFLHVFSHKSQPYRFDHRDKTDWIAQYFFTGGIMPSHKMIGQFSELFTLEQDWFWNGENYAHTARDWLANYDRNQSEIQPILREVYGNQATVWNRRWRLFYLATAGLFGHHGGTEWGVSHYRLRPTL